MSSIMLLNPKIISFLSFATILTPIHSFSTSPVISKLHDLKTLCLITSPTSTALSGYLDGLSSPTPNDDNEKNKKPPSHFQPKKPLPSGGGGGIPCGRGPLGSYLDAMTGSSSTSNNDNGYPRKNENDDYDEEDFFQITKNKKNNHASGSGAYLQNFLVTSINPNNAFYQDDARTDIRNLLTQRSIQSFMRLCEECRDPHSAKWIQEVFLEQKGNLMGFHGTGAKFIEDFGGRWDEPLLQLTQEAPTTIVVSAKRRGRGHGGWSKHNPYLKERWVEMTVNIDPTNLATRILSVREQIGMEWVDDLNVLIEANEEILNSFYEGAQDMKETQERKAAYLVSNNSRFATKLSSPYRRSNFDLLYNLCTQAAIHRILRDFQNSDDLSFHFLRDFYTNVASDYFDGELEFGRADEFVEELLDVPPCITPSGQIIRNPLLLAELIIQKRGVVAEDWKTLMERVPADHTGIRQLLFNNQFQSSSPMNNLGDDLDSLSFQ